jgi:hypothetical protein
MIVVVDLTSEPAVVSLAEPEDCRRFHVEVRGDGEPGAARRAIEQAGAGRMDADGAMIAAEWIRTQAAGRVPESWAGDFDGMLAFARDKGWLDDRTGTIQAHVEPG